MEKKEIKLPKESIKEFKKSLRNFQKEHPLRDFPWRETTDPYHIAVSELMLQQTQTDRVVPKYSAFIKKFPTVRTLAAVPQSEVIKLWSGLGYNRRALYLKRMAEVIATERKGKFPTTLAELQQLPGIGPYTAAAISAFAFNEPVVVIETNIRTVYLHHFFSDRRSTVDDKEIAILVEATLDRSDPRQWYNLLMDYGVHLKKSGSVVHRKSKHYAKQSAFSGSLREVRGAILRLLSEKPFMESALKVQLGKTDERFPLALQGLIQDGFIIKKRSVYALADTHL